MFENFFIGRLSGKLLVLTILFVMVAELLIFIPSCHLPPNMVDGAGNIGRAVNFGH